METTIEQTIADKEKELQEVSANLSTIHHGMYELDKQILTLRLTKKDLDDGEQKARARLRILSSELRVLKDEFWRSKGK